MADVRKIVDVTMLGIFKDLMTTYVDNGDAGVKKFFTDTLGTLPEGKTIAQAIADAQTAATYDDTDVKKSISDLEALVGVLPEGATVDTVVKYIDQQVQIAKNQAKAAQDDVDALETLVGSLPEDAVATTVIGYAKEVADSKDAAIKAAKDAADAAQGDVDSLEELVGTIPTGATATTVVAYAKEVADAAAGDASQVAADLAQEVTDRQADTKAIKDSIGTVTEGETVVSMIADAKKAGTDADAHLEAYKTTNDAAVEAAQTQADKGVADAATAQKTADDLNTLVGFTAGEGEDDPKTVVDYIDAKVAEASSDASKVADDLADEIERATGVEEGLDSRLEIAEGKIATLVGDDANKSVRTIANEELAAQLIPEGAKESLDTLKEIADWIQKHPDDAAAMNKAIEDLETLVGTIPEDVTATTVVGMIQELVSAEEKRATDVEEDFEDRISDLETAIGEGGSVAAQITAEIEKLDATVTNEVEGQDKPDVTVTVVEADGKLTSVSATVNAKYDVEGAAKAVQGDTTSTVKKVEDDLAAFMATIAYAERADIEKLFQDEVVDNGISVPAPQA